MPDTVMTVPENTSPEVVRLVELINLGARYHNEKNYEAARLHALAALRIDPENAPALLNLAGSLILLDYPEAALAICRRGLAIMPGHPGFLMNMGSALVHCRRFAEGIDVTKQAMALRPEDAGLWHNLGLAYCNTNRHERALGAYERALELSHERSDEMMSDRAIVMLALGQLEAGLEAYNVRFYKLFKQPYPIPEWAGEDISTKHLILFHEQGFGDSLMMSRFVSRIGRMCAKLTFAVPSELVRLMALSFPGISVRDWKDPDLQRASAADVACPMFTAARWLGVKAPDDVRYPAPYLTLPDDSRIPLPVAPLRVGLCWGSGDHGREFRRRKRIVPLAHFMPLLEMPGMKVISLQKAQPLHDGRPRAGDPHNDIHDLGVESIVYDPMMLCEDFAGTASVISRLDLVISVDSAVAHLAGALGKPTIMLGPYTRCWRWWDETTGAPWYDNFKIQTQNMSGDWAQAAAEACEAVRKRARQKAAQS